MSESVQVHLAVGGDTRHVGIAHIEPRRQGVTTTFTYSPTWLADRRAFPLDPGLPLSAGAHTTAGLPGALGDSTPDRWGRNLISRRVRADARSRQRTPPSVSELDFLLGVSDLTRQGALRLRRSDDGPFVAPGTEVPKLLELPRLLRAAEAVVRDADESDTAVKVLLDAGTGSLGGARPKATVRSDEGRLLIAKFPHHHDDWDVGRWEKTALDLAELAGVDVPARRVAPIGRGSCLLVERFDRDPRGGRIPYLSGLSLVSGRDGEDLDHEVLVAHLEESGAGDNAELAALYRRVVLSVAIHNTDDHLRNTGFLRASDGWRLSPLFDVNPNPDLGSRRQTAISGAYEVDEEAEGLVRLAEWCRLGPDSARRVIGEVVSAVGRWREIAIGNGVARPELDRFADMFDHRLGALKAME